MLGKFILDGHEPIQTDDLMLWARWFEVADRHVANDKIQDVTVSTVFLGLDHNFQELGPPILFETKVFGGEYDGEMDRFCTWEEAEAGHKAMLAKVRGE